MKRLYFLVPTIESTISIVDEFRSAAIPDQDIYVVGKDHHRLQMAHLHEAGILQTTDLLRALKLGLAIGAVIGIISGFLVTIIIKEALTVDASLVISLGIFGAAFGAWASTLIGSSTPNPRIWKFESAIKNGKLLMLVDIPKEREQEVIERIKQHHPEAIIEGYALSRKDKKQRLR